MRKLSILLLICSSTIIVSCFNAENSKKIETKTVVAKEYKFEPPVIPSFHTTNEGRAEYYATNYWKKYNFQDTSLISRADITEQAFVDFISVIPNTPKVVIEKAFDNLFNYAVVKDEMIIHFLDLGERYLGGPNSPLRNEEVYIIMLERYIANDSIDDSYKIRPKHKLEQSKKNRVGAIATDFTYILPNGKKGSLHKIKSDLLVIFFYNPECPVCEGIRNYMDSSPILKDAEKRGKLKVLAICLDVEEKGWVKYQSEISRDWINGYDKGDVIENKQLYCILAAPTLYLLDKDKKVILKDPTIEVVQNAVMQLAK